MENLSERNYELIRQGAKTTGNYIDTYYYIEERLYIGEAETIFEFLKWCNDDPDNRSFGDINYQQRFNQFLKQKNNGSDKNSMG